jgi:pimeloyl-ACP methyl ester carboxylesterase
MPDVAYSPLKTDLFFPAQRGDFFKDIPASNVAAVCAEMARLAYCRKEPAFSFDRDQIAEVLQGRGYTPQFFESKGASDGSGTHGLLAMDHPNKVAIVAFRGTDALDHIDLADDADALPIRWEGGGKVHEGFAEALDHVKEDLLPAIDALKAQQYKMLYAGHSLGAAMATLLASLRPPDHLYTIGSPRVGNRDFLATLAKVDSSRFVDCCDIVTRLPPELVGVYDHLGPPLYIDRNRKVRKDPGKWTMRLDQFRASLKYLQDFSAIKGNVAVRELADHAPINYVDAIRAYDGT